MIDTITILCEEIEEIIATAMTKARLEEMRKEWNANKELVDNYFDQVIVDIKEDQK